MRRIIDGRLYDTETATELGTDSYGYQSDFSHWEETLYRTRRGSFFVAGGGGPLTRWAVHVGQGERAGSEGIRVFSAREALHWAEKAGVSAEEIAKFFAVEEA